jgi:uncharacterized protein (DUF1778 family)
VFCCCDFKIHYTKKRTLALNRSFSFSRKSHHAFDFLLISLYALCHCVVLQDFFLYRRERKLRLVLNALDLPFSHLHSLEKDEKNLNKTEEQHTAQQKETKKERKKKGINHIFLLSCYYLFLKRKLDFKRNTST